jgi:hypothetical protein
MAKRALDAMDHPGYGPGSGIGHSDIQDLARMALGNMNGVSSKFIPNLPEEDDSIESLTSRALQAMPADSNWVDDAMSGDRMKISDLAKRALAKQFPPVSGGIQDKLNEEDQKEAEEIALKEAERIQNEQAAAVTKENIEAELGSAK